MIRRRRQMVAPLLTAEARAVPIAGFEYARRLGLPCVGCEHWLIALAGVDHPAAAALREHGVTPERVEEQVVRLSGGGLCRPSSPRSGRRRPRCAPPWRTPAAQPGSRRGASLGAGVAYGAGRHGGTEHGC